jgi:hypothetical protein
MGEIEKNEKFYESETKKGQLHRTDPFLIRK